VKKINKFFDLVADKSSEYLGKPLIFVIACSVCLVWLVSGPIFNWSDTWQLLINTGTTVITFLMIFLVQNSQNKDSKAIQLKLDRLIEDSEDVRSDAAGIEKDRERIVELDNEQT